MQISDSLHGQLSYSESTECSYNAALDDPLNIKWMNEWMNKWMNFNDTPAQEYVQDGV